MAVHVSVNPLLPSGSDMVPEAVPLAEVAAGNGAFRVPVPVPDILPLPYDAYSSKVIEVPDMTPLVMCMS